MYIYAVVHLTRFEECLTVTLIRITDEPLFPKNQRRNYMGTGYILRKLQNRMVNGDS